MSMRMLLSLVAVSVVAVPPLVEAGAAMTGTEQLGHAIFMDPDLSSPPGQACASCHGKQTGFSGPTSRINRETAVYPGALSGRYGNRRPPAAAYAGSVPPFFFDTSTSQWRGGLFYDGRATGWRLGDPLAEQALGPFLNPLEQNNADAFAVCDTIRVSAYADLFETVWGPGSLDCEGDIDGTYDLIGLSIAAYERSGEVSPYTSKYDYALAGQVQLTAEEAAGLTLFEGEAGCASCHSTAIYSGTGHPELTDFGYANLGLPRNEANPFYDMGDEWNPDGDAWTDPGLAATLTALGYPADVCAAELGKHRTPTVRNVDRRPGPSFVKAYGHNGYFKSLEAFVHFLNSRDVPGEGWQGVPWPAPEVAENLSTAVGDLGLTPEEEGALVAFLKRLSDGYPI